jgi:hypothetical protein
LGGAGVTQTFAGKDLTIGDNGDLLIVSGLDAVLFDAERAAKALLGEMVLAIDEGIPYFQVVWNGSPNVNQFEAALRRRLLSLADVLEVVTLSTRQLAGTLSYEATIRTVYGVGVING